MSAEVLSKQGESDALRKEQSESEDLTEKLQSQVENVKREQEDLLILLSDQDVKLDNYKKQLRELGQEVCRLVE